MNNEVESIMKDKIKRVENCYERRRRREKGLGKFINTSFLRKGDKNRSERYYVRIPPVLVHHPAFPFTDQEKVRVRLETGRIVIEKLTK